MPSEYAYIGMNRFGLGADSKALSALNLNASLPDVQSWLIRQLKAYSMPKSEWTSASVIKAHYEFQKLKNARDSSPQQEKQFKELRRNYVSRARKMAKATVIHGHLHEQSIQARLFAFFSNHFSVSRQNLQMTLLSPTLEVEAIAPNLHLYFSDMLVAVVKHPAMLFYLNNEGSTGPNSKVGKRRKGKKFRSGLNENLAREILELHTLGVNADYTQNDVIELAKALSGWSIGSIKRGERAGFVFRKNSHEPGTRVVLNQRYEARANNKEVGESILRTLANHESCAGHVCTKLVQHFIADEAPSGIVASMKEAWLKTQGHLPSVIEAMIKHDESWQYENKKFKTPRDYVASSLRAFDANIAHNKTPRNKSPNNKLFETFELMGHGFFNSGSPSGYPDDEESWLSASALNTRIEWASQLASLLAKHKELDPVLVASNSLGPFLQSPTLDSIKRAESKQMAIAIMLLSPEFQRR